MNNETLNDETLKTRTRITADEFYQSPEYAQYDVIQLVDGEMVIGEGNDKDDIIPPILRHQAIVVATIVFLSSYAKQQGGRVYTAPAEVYLDENNIYEPDVFYISPSPKCKREEKRVVGPPDLVVEVLSPSSIKRDRVTKYAAYERNGVREYWLADPVYSTVQVYVLGQDGSFQSHGLFMADETFTSPCLNNQSVAVADLLAD